MIEGILIGLQTALSLKNILMVMMGCFFGTIIGMLPGLGPMTAIALMIPITYGFEPSTGLILMAGVYYGAVFGGSTSSILINAPGVPGTVATAFDGYPMAQQGKAGKALAIAAYSSFAGGTIAAIFLLFAAPSLSKVSLAFRSPDYFALMILGLTAVAAFSSKGQFLKAMMMAVLGLMLASVGQDTLSDIPRFVFNNMNLSDGISFVLVVMATFAMSEALTMSNRIAVFNDGKIQQISSPDVLYEKPNSSFVAQFIGENNQLRGKVKSINGENCIVTTESGDDIHALKINVNNNGDGSLVSLRPERVAINSSENFENNFDAKVKELIYLGDHIRSRVEVCGNDQFIVKIPNSYKEANLKEGSTVKLSWKASDSRALDLN